MHQRCPHSLPRTTHPYFFNIRRLPNMDPKFNSIQSPLSRREGVTKSWSKMISFYLYPLELFPLFWGPNTSCDHSIMLTPKHDGYIHAIQAMKRHPWRTSNPHEAMLAILPISLDIYTRGGCPGLGWLFSDVRFMHVIQLTGKRLSMTSWDLNLVSGRGEGFITLNNFPDQDAIIEELKNVINASPIFPTIRHLFISLDSQISNYCIKLSILSIFSIVTKLPE